MKVLEIRGDRALEAFNAYQLMLVGIHMLPKFWGKTEDEFFSDLENMSHEQVEETLRYGVCRVKMQPDEKDCVLSFVTDPNGVPFSKNNRSNLSLEQEIDAIVLVFMEFAKMKIRLVKDSEKKKSQTGLLI